MTDVYSSGASTISIIHSSYRSCVPQLFNVTKQQRSVGPIKIFETRNTWYLEQSHVHKRNSYFAIHKICMFLNYKLSAANRSSRAGSDRVHGNNDRD